MISGIYLLCRDSVIKFPLNRLTFSPCIISYIIDNVNKFLKKTLRARSFFDIDGKLDRLRPGGGLAVNPFHDYPHGAINDFFFV